jgi:hypothetical protein
MTEPDNEDRAGFALSGVEAYARTTRSGSSEQTVSVDGPDDEEGREHAEEVISDLLCDLRHLCDVLGVNFQMTLGRSLRDYTEEVAEERHARLESLRGELDAERISAGELVELQSLAPYIEDWDVQLLEAAGVPEHPPAEFTEKREALALQLFNTANGPLASLTEVERHPDFGPEYVTNYMADAGEILRLYPHLLGLGTRQEMGLDK